MAPSGTAVMTMEDSRSKPGGAPTTGVEDEPPERPMRADAVVNRLRVLEAAEEVFASQGVAAQIDAVAEQAGVGVGTVYRHFSTKEALFEAIVLRRLQELAAMAEAQAASDDAGQALFAFLREFASRVSNKHDLIDALSVAGIDIKSQCAEMAARLDEGVQRLLERAQESGAVRRGVTAREVTGLIVGACQSAERYGGGQKSQTRMVDVVCDGLRRPVGSRPRH